MRFAIVAFSLLYSGSNVPIQDGHFPDSKVYRITKSKAAKHVYTGIVQEN